MDYKEALKQVQAGEKKKENFLVFNFSYGVKVLLPHSQGINLLASLAGAEELDDDYGKNLKVRPLDKSKVTITTLSREEYEQSKIASLLGISINDLLGQLATA